MDRPNYFDGIDMLRISRLMFPRDDDDFAYFCVAIVLLLYQIDRYGRKWPLKFLEIRPPDLIRGVRMYISRSETFSKSWTRYPRVLKLMQELNRQNDIDTMIGSFTDAISSLADFLL